MANTNLANAKTAKNDEFYTQYSDIQKEMNAYLEYNPDVFRGKTVLLPCDDPEWSNFTKFFAQNFESFGIKKLISTSYAVESKKIQEWEPTIFETESPYYDADKSRTNGKIFILDEDINNDGRFNINDLRWTYLNGDGDFRSDEVKAFRDEADIIITYPPNSLFREFFRWIMDAGKQFIIVGEKRAIPYDEVFPFIKEKTVWLGSRGFSSDMVFAFPNGTDVKENARKKAEELGYVGNYAWFGNVCWFTNVAHGGQQKIYIDDIEIAKAIIERNVEITRCYYYEKLFHLFESFNYIFFTDCTCSKEFLDEIYVHVMLPNDSGKRKLEDFYGGSTLYTWFYTVCINYCRKKFKRKERGPDMGPFPPHREDEDKNDGGSDRGEIVGGSNEIDFSDINRSDVETLLKMMPNTRYRKVMRLRHLKEWTNEEVAKELGVSMDVYYNVHKRAIEQYKEVCRKEEYHG